MFNLFKRKKQEIDVVVKVRKVKEGWNNPTDVFPVVGQHCEIDCGEFGIRTAIYLPKGYILMTWMLTDCTHPAQNMNMNPDYVECWRSIDKQKAVTETAIFEIIN